MKAYFIYRIDKGLGIVPRELFDHPNLVIVHKDCCDQRYALVRGEGMIDQLFPGWVFTTNEKVIKLINVWSSERMRNQQSEKSFRGL